MNIRVLVVTSDRYLWALRPFHYLFDVFWSTLQPVLVAGYTPPPFPLPPNFQFQSIDPRPYPAEMWSDGLILFLRGLPDSHVVLMLEDYWLCRRVDTQGVNSLADYIHGKQEVLRMDLTNDRLYAGGMFDVEPWGHYDIIETPPGTPYQMSLQAGIWNRERLLEVLQPGKTPWQVEVETGADAMQGLRVLGTRQSPIRYINAFKSGDAENALNLGGLPQEHADELNRRGWLLR